jgi:hypothetical protein
MLIPHVSKQLIQAAKLDKLPDSIHSVKVEVEVMHRIQNGRKDLFRHEQMP